MAYCLNINRFHNKIKYAYIISIALYPYINRLILEMHNYKQFYQQITQAGSPRHLGRNIVVSSRNNGSEVGFALIAGLTALS